MYAAPALRLVTETGPVVRGGQGRTRTDITQDGNGLVILWALGAAAIGAVAAIYAISKLILSLLGSPG